MKIIYKIFFFTMLLIISTITFGILSNKLFLNSYYVALKEKELIRIASTLDTRKLIPVEKKNIDIDNETSYNFIPRRMLENTRLEVKAFKKNNYEFEILKFSRGPAWLKLIVKKTPEGQYALITPLEQVEKAVEVSNTFYVYVGLISLVFSIPLVIVFSKYLSKRITLINGNIKEIINLNFSEKLDLHTRDEFGETANNLNLLAQTLENNLQNLKNMNIKLQHDIDYERKKDQDTKNFITAITHELKTPITIMNTHAEFIAGGYADTVEELQEYAGEIINEGHHMTKLIDSLLVLLKSSSLLHEFNFEVFELREFINSILLKYKVDFDTKGILLDFNVPKTMVNSNRNLLLQVIINLISNAISFVPDDGTGIIKIHSFSKGDHLTLEIINNGPLIPDEIIDKIWKPFFKEDDSRNRKYGGTGLGLSIVKGTLDKLNCSCGVVNLKDGVKFWFDIEKSV